MRGVAYAIAAVGWISGLLMTICILVMAYSGASLYACELSHIRESACMMTEGEYAQDAFLLALIGFGVFGCAFILTGPFTFWAYTQLKEHS